MIVETATALRTEEHEEAVRHDLLYGAVVPARLELRPDAWERFDGVGEPLTPYAASVLRLGAVRDRNVLDAGCGDGWLSVIMAKRGAIVDGFDISRMGIAVARQRAAANAVAWRCSFAVGSFYQIPYPDGRFDAVIGQAILHHLRDKHRAAEELRRVMKPGARAVFSEPFGNVRWLERMRRLVPVQSEAPEDPTEWARQFKYEDLRPFEALFDVQVEEYQLVSRLDRIVSWRPFVNATGHLDRWLLRAVPGLRPFARAIVIELRPR